MIPELTQNYSDVKNKNINILNLAITPTDEKEVTLYLYRSHGHSSLLNRATLNSTREVKCPSMKLSAFLTEQDIGTVEVLFIDCEGLDLLILKSTNLFDLDIKCIYFEYWPHQNDDKSGNFSTTHYELDEFFNLYKDFYEIEECNIEGMKTFKMIRNN